MLSKGRLQFMTVLTVIIICQIQQSWSRYVTLTFNLTISLSNDHLPLPNEIVTQCLKETEISMEQLQRFREMILRNNPLDEHDRTHNNDDKDDVGAGNMEYIDENETEYDVTKNIAPRQHTTESLECFAHCLYKQFGLLTDYSIEEEVYRRLLKLIEFNQPVAVECTKIVSTNYCEATYKMLLCYKKLKYEEKAQQLQQLIDKTHREFEKSVLNATVRTETKAGEENTNADVADANEAEFDNEAELRQRWQDVVNATDENVYDSDGDRNIFEMIAAHITSSKNQIDDYQDDN